MTEKPVFNGILQVAVVVKNCDAAVKKYYDGYGIGPWMIYDYNPDTVQDMVLRGKPEGYAMRLALANVSNLTLELIEPRDDKSIYAEFLREHGEGLHHVAFGTESYSETTQFFQKKGFDVLQAGTWQNFKYAYFDTREDLGLISEIFDEPPGFKLSNPDAVYPHDYEPP